MDKLIQLTEQDLHMLVEDTVSSILKENGVEEGVWGGLKNVWQGAKQGNFNVGQTYNSGNIASNFQKYAQQAMQAIRGMSQIATDTGNKQIDVYLAQVMDTLNNTVKFFNNTASKVASGDMSYRYNKDNGHNIFKVNNKNLNRMGYKNPKTPKNTQQVPQQAPQQVQQTQQQVQQRPQVRPYPIGGSMGNAARKNVRNMGQNN